jgi:hypothetical protein
VCFCGIILYFDIIQTENPELVSGKQRVLVFPYLKVFKKEFIPKEKKVIGKDKAVPVFN